MPVAIAVSVPEDEAEDLRGLEPSFVAPPEQVEAHPFDGEALAQLVGVLSTGGLSTLAVWLRARAKQRKHFRVSVDGMELTGYEVDEAERIIGLLQSKVTDKEA